ncbi:aromatic amino acid lyase [Prauserella muralis]|uniref:Phenylalanine and histidine ammonia-lyase n=1 Tax=Prauserella muralis TaxID=588067 RepID=A0A2V4AQF0_9PSEU|nr:aromatic amino acid lyase [Prauserella muralis]PXY22589.1 phenylalanine and histidine ammonia-lyase [Prauserella muralis]TWE28286.1 histidine ammonia-lyase [Prauserella muralis]
MTIVVGQRPLTPGDVLEAARHGARVAFADAVPGWLQRERAVVDDVVDRQVPAYGVTTGLGSRAGHALPRAELAAFSLRTVRGRANAVGAALPAEVVRAAMLARLGGIAAGGSGITPAVANLLVDMLNAGVHPVVPETGSIGASDLNQMAHIALAVVGEGRAELAGDVLDSAVALRRAGLEPVPLGPKDGLVLCGASPLAAGTAALAAADTDTTWMLAQAVAALTYEGFRANTSPLDPRAQRARPAPGQQEAAAGLLALLEGGELTDPRAARRIQDPLSLRCVAQTHGSLRAALSFLDNVLATELNGSGDNPIVLADDGEVLSTGNFHTPGLALACDTLALALCQTAALSAGRTQRLLDASVSGLPANLSPYGPERSGLAPLVKTAQALVTEIRHAATPVCTDPRQSADGVEDDSTNAAFGARRLAAMLTRLRYLLAVEALAAAQAVHLAAPARLGHGPQRLLTEIREVVPPLDDDRPSGDDVERVAREVLGAEPVHSDLRALLTTPAAESARTRE